MKHSLVLGVVLFIVWLLLSGYYDVRKEEDRLLITFGIISSITVVLLCRRMGIVDGEAQPFHLLPGLFLFMPWLIKEIIFANVDIARRVLDPRFPISPKLVKAKATQKTELGQVIYANSITLTPGTVSIRIRDGVILVHALTKENADALSDGDMDRRVTALEAKS